MMRAMTIDTEAWFDGRLVTLGRALGENRYSALTKVACIWAQYIGPGSPPPSAAFIAGILEVDTENAFALLVGSGLALDDGKGGVVLAKLPWFDVLTDEDF